MLLEKKLKDMAKDADEKIDRRNMQGKAFKKRCRVPPCSLGMLPSELPHFPVAEHLQMSPVLLSSHGGSLFRQGPLHHNPLESHFLLDLLVVNVHLCYKVRFSSFFLQ